MFSKVLATCAVGFFEKAFAAPAAVAYEAKAMERLPSIIKLVVEGCFGLVDGCFKRAIIVECFLMGGSRMTVVVYCCELGVEIL